jgi:hypothetical protein
VNEYYVFAEMLAPGVMGDRDPTEIADEVQKRIEVSGVWSGPSSAIDTEKGTVSLSLVIPRESMEAAIEILKIYLRRAGLLVERKHLLALQIFILDPAVSGSEYAFPTSSQEA